MTPIGHFMSAAAVAGTVDLTTERETLWCFAYYAIFLAVFAVLAQLFLPGPWAMHLHDDFGNAGLLFFLAIWLRKTPRQKYFLCLLLGGQVLSAYTHIFDVLALKIIGAVPEGMWRPHTILHTPLAAIVISLAAAAILRPLLRGTAFRGVFFFLLLGYAMHIVMDTWTYAFPVYPLWPLSSMHASLAGFFQPPDAVSAWLGHPLYVFSRPDAANIDGFIVYSSEVVVNALLAALFFAKGLSSRLLRGSA